MPLDKGKWAKCKGKEQGKSKKLGQKKGCRFPGSLEWRLYFLFIHQWSVAWVLLTLGQVPRIVHSLPRAPQWALVASPRAVAAVGSAMPWICLPVLPGEQLPAAALDRRGSGTWKLFNLGWGRVARAEAGPCGFIPSFSRPFFHPG